MKKSWAAACYVVLVFVAGVTAGALGHRVLTAREVVAKANPPSPAEWRSKHVAEMKARLKLTEAQVADLNKILDATRDQYRAARERAKPEMKRIHDEQIARITAMLSTGQRPEYEQIVEEHDRQRKLREAGGR